MKRFLKIVGILALFALAIAYVAFRVVFFDPFAGPRASLDPLIPQDIDLMVRRREIAKDFEPFPMPRFWKSLRVKDEWRALERTRLWRELEPKLGIGPAFAQLEQLRTEPLDLMKDLAGREVMLLGRWKPDGVLAWAVVTRGSFRAKLAAEALKLALARKAAGDAIRDFVEQDGVKSFTAEGRRWHLARSEDALICGNDFELVRDVTQAEDASVGLDDSPQYRSAVLSESPVGRPLDFVVDVAEACKQLGVAWPPPAPHEPLGIKLARELLDPAKYRLAMGRIALGGQVELATTLAVDRAALQPVAAGLFGGASTRLADLHSFCGRVFPEKVAACGAVRLNVREFLRRIEALADPDLRQLLNDFVVGIKWNDPGFQPKSTIELLDAFAAVVTDEVAFAIEPDEPYQVPAKADEEVFVQFPNPNWGPRIALIFPVAEKGSAEKFLERLVVALSARHNAISNVWVWQYKELGIKFREIKTIDLDYPTVSIGQLELQGRECIVITTTGQFLHELVQQKNAADHGDSSGLQADVFFRQAGELADGFGQGFAFLSAPNLRRVLHDYAVVWAEEQTRPDWTKVRREIERQLVARQPGRDLDAVKKQIEAEVDEEITKRERTWKEVTLPAKTEELKADLDGLDMIRWLAAVLRVEDRDVGLRVRIATPANFGE